MWTAADPDTFAAVQITEQAPASTQRGQVILAGTADG
jgi:hypothetical protein